MVIDIRVHESYPTLYNFCVSLHILEVFALYPVIH